MLKQDTKHKVWVTVLKEGAKFASLPQSPTHLFPRSQAWVMVGWVPWELLGKGYSNLEAQDQPEALLKAESSGCLCGSAAWVANS